MRDYTITLNGVSVTVQARNFFTACSVAAEKFLALGVDTRTAA